MKQNWFQLILTILVLIFCFSLFVSAGGTKEETRRVRTEPGYHKFILTKGKRVEVCEAYLKRLNKTWFEKLPFCGRPENTDVPGFEKLNRVALSAEEIYPIEYRIRDFIYTGNQYIHDKSDEMRPENKEKVIFFINQGLELQSLGAYRYNPPIDFDNDQKPDNLLVWEQSRFSCGSIHEEYGLFPTLGMTIVFILEPDSLSVDAKKTKALIGHPIGCYPKPDGKGCYDNRFRPIGDSMGIFRYKGITYFDTFFNTWGDFEGKRGKDPNIWRTLGVFKREKGQTKQVCECLWEISYEKENYN
jgi:hypothetical protein